MVQAGCRALVASKRGIMVSIRVANVIASIVVIVFGVTFVVLSLPIYSTALGGGPGAGAFPLWVGTLVAAGGVIYLIRALRERIPQPFITPDRSQRVQLLHTAVSIVAYVALMNYLGFTLSTFLLIGYQLRVIGRYHFVFSVAFAAITAVVFSYVFRNWFYMPLPLGVIGA